MKAACFQQAGAAPVINKTESLFATIMRQPAIEWSKISCHVRSSGLCSQESPITTVHCLTLSVVRHAGQQDHQRRLGGIFSEQATQPVAQPFHITEGSKTLMVKDDVSTVTNRPAIKPVTGAIWSACGIWGNVSRDDLTALQEADRTQIIVAHGWIEVKLVVQSGLKLTGHQRRLKYTKHKK